MYMKMKKYILLVFVSAMLVGLTACDKDEENPLCGWWYVNPDDSDSDYYYFNYNYTYSNSGYGGFYDCNYSNSKINTLDCKFSWEADDKHLFLHYDYYNRYTQKQVEKRVLYYYDISGKHLILYDHNFNYVGTYTKR